MDLYLGLDLGTSGCKLLAFNARGRQLARSARGYTVSTPQAGHAELDPDSVWAAAEACFAEIDARALNGRVRTLAVSCQGEAVIPVDRDGTVLASSPISADMRALDELAAIERRFGAEYIYSVTGQPPQSIYTLSRLKWWHRVRPDMVAATSKFLCYGDFALLRLGLEPVIDAGMASRTMAYDINHGAWASDLLSFAGISIPQMPPVVSSGTIVGEISSDIADRLCLPEGVLVVVGGHDQSMGALGAGAGRPGSAVYSIGTTITMVLVSAVRPDWSPGCNVPFYPHVTPGCFVSTVGSQSGGRVLNWYNQIEQSPLGSTTIESRLGELTDTWSNWPLLVPHLAGSGSILNDPSSLGAFFGLTFDTTRDDLLLSTLEGITLELALSLETLARTASVPIEGLRVLGGGARSSFWLQMTADILGKPLTRVHSFDAPCLGAAILGRTALEGGDAAEFADEMTVLEATFFPRPERHEIHARRLAVYAELYKALRGPARRLREVWI